MGHYPSDSEVFRVNKISEEEERRVKNGENKILEIFHKYQENDNQCYTEKLYFRHRKNSVSKKSGCMS